MSIKKEEKSSLLNQLKSEWYEVPRNYKIWKYFSSQYFAGLLMCFLKKLNKCLGFDLINRIGRRIWQGWDVAKNHFKTWFKIQENLGNFYPWNEKMKLNTSKSHVFGDL